MNPNGSVCLTLLLVALMACTRAPERKVADEAGTPDAATTPTNRVDIPATVRRHLGITFAEVEVRHVAQTQRVPGAFELQPGARHEYRMALAGEVRILVKPFDRVEPGTPLYRYRSPAWTELAGEVLRGEHAVAVARAQLRVRSATLEEVRQTLALAKTRIQALAQAEFKRVDLEIQAAQIEASLPRLAAEVELAAIDLANAISAREHALRRASMASGIAAAELEAAAPSEEGRSVSLPRYLAIDWIEVRAFVAGVVEAVATTDGAFVESPALVLSTIDPTLVQFRAHALQADLAKFVDASAARIVRPPSPGTPTDDGVPASMQLGLDADPNQRTLTLMATPTVSAAWARPGVAAFLEIVGDDASSPVLAVPRSAVVQDGLLQVVFRRDPSNPNRAIRIEADTGVSDGWWVALNSGVMRGDEVVVAGAYELKLATQQSGSMQKGGHVHADGSFHAEH